MTCMRPPSNRSASQRLAPPAVRRSAAPRQASQTPRSHELEGGRPREPHRRTSGAGLAVNGSAAPRPSAPEETAAPIRPCACLVAACLVLLAADALAQMAQREAHIGYVYPAGGRQGTTFEAVIGGSGLNEAEGVLVSGAGVTAVISKQERQVTPKEQQELKEQLGKLKEKRQQGERMSAEDLEMAMEAKEKLTAFGRRLANPSLGEFVTIRVTVATNAAPGMRALRLLSRAGLSNPRTFVIGQLPEVSKSDWKNVPQTRLSLEPKSNPTPPPVAVTLPVTLNGQIPPGGVDTYCFTAQAGQRLVVSVSARELIPYLADAVPGWVQATVGLYDAQSNEVAFADDYKSRPDPVIFYAIPRDGAYTLKIRDSLYRGREDFVYRITVGEVPFVTGVFPAGGKVGTRTPVSVSGWNLPCAQAELDFAGAQPGLHPFQVGRTANAVPLLLDTLPERFEAEPNDAKTNATPVALPVIINARVDRPGDWDVYRFEGHAGEQVVAEVFARRLDSPVDSLLRLIDPSGKQVAANDDREDKGSGLNTHHADSYLAARLLADGTYTVYVGDTQRAGGPAYSYRLRLSAPRPDFELRVTPSGLNVRAGASVPLTAFALRKDGFTNAIALALVGAPKGYRLDGATIPAGQDQVTFTLTAPLDAPEEPVSFQMEGRASLHGAPAVRPAVPADDMMQAFAYRHLVPAHALTALAIGRMRFRSEPQVRTPSPIRLAAGGTARVDIFLPTGGFIKDIQYELVAAPDGLSVKDSTADGLVLQADASKMKPGMTGNLIISASGSPPKRADAPPAANAFRFPLGTFPAVTFVITP